MSPSRGADPSAVRRAWWASVLMLGAVVITPVLLGILSVQAQADIGVTNQELALCVTGFWACTAIGAATGAGYADRAGWRRAAVIGLALCVVGHLGIAASPSMGVLMASLAVGGVAYGIVAPTSNVVLAKEIPPRLHGVALGVKQSAGPVAGLVAGLAVPVVALTIGWRWAFVMVALVPLAAMAISAIGWSRPPTIPVERRDESPTRTPPQDRSPTRTVSVADTPNPPSLSIPRIAVAAGLGTLSIGVLTTFSVQTLVRSGVDVAAAGLIIAAASLASVLVRLGAGWLTDRRGSDGLVPGGLMIGLGAIGLVAIASGSTVATIAGTLLAFCGAWGWPALLLLGVMTYHPRNTGRASGRFQIGTAIGAAVGPALFAFVSDLTSFTVGWFVIAGLTAVSSLLVLYAAPGRGPRVRVPALSGS